MARFTVVKTVDAYVRYTAEVEADTPEKAAEIAREHEDDYKWEEDSVSEYDARSFATLDADGDVIEETTIGDL